MAGGRSAREGRTRLDLLLVARGLCETRTRAQALIMAGKVIVGDHTETKPGTQVDEGAPVRLRGQDHGYASRGGLKLRGALDAFVDLRVEDVTAMDIGASTGGFTDCLLQAGARRVYAVDVGYGQLAWKLARDPRVISIERQNIRTLARERVPEPIELAVIDCSFISLTLVLPHVPPFLADRGDVVALVKPQFELGPAAVGKGGIVRDPAGHAAATRQVIAAADDLGFACRGLCDSPIQGRDGNREFLVWLSWERSQDQPS
ncbi:MAG: TlyA family RNA methyltransferase [Nannocystaceae bacterium]|nr:TlyA family RNA methyltransferase [Myxococcales bacterium]